MEKNYLYSILKVYTKLLQYWHSIQTLIKNMFYSHMNTQTRFTQKLKNVFDKVKVNKVFIFQCQIIIIVL